MAYCPPELLDDLAGVLADVRTWSGVVEKRPFVFYLQRQPFLHFHLLARGRRRVDVKGRARWVQLDVPHPATATKRRTLLGELRARYRERTTTESGGKDRSARLTRSGGSRGPGDRPGAGARAGR